MTITEISNSGPMVFTGWLVDRHLNKDTPFGDLADDIWDDMDFPAENTRKAILDYLERQHACHDCLRTFTRAWSSYLRYLKYRRHLERSQADA